ncbi:unnamed protein product [Timema podura]|uniref:Uncharacterized protein n=1 Tax=Timema podura TaxID=61482 RepID=A0ABN7NEK8_TIMPD|nr:unnamed protein product [Timema podura]
MVMVYSQSTKVFSIAANLKNGPSRDNLRHYCVFSTSCASTVNDFSSLLQAIIAHPNDVKCYVDCILKELHFLTDAGFNEKSVTAAVGFYGNKSEKMKCKIPVDYLQKCFDTDTSD